MCNREKPQDIILEEGERVNHYKQYNYLDISTLLTIINNHNQYQCTISHNRILLFSIL